LTKVVRETLNHIDRRESADRFGNSASASAVGISRLRWRVNSLKLYRPRMMGHCVEPYAAMAAG
jgi:hypothetical protein